MKRRQIILLMLPLAAVAISAFIFIRGRSGGDLLRLRVSGSIEATDAEVSFKIPGRVRERLVSEGETVRAGQVVARLEDTELRLEVALRRAEVEAARAALAELESGSRPEEIRQAEAAVRRAQARLSELLAGSRVQEVEVARAEVERARADAELMRLEQERKEGLYRGGYISDREYDLARSEYQVARARLKEAQERLELVREGPRAEEIEQARAALKEAEERFLLVKRGPRRETIEQARARLQQAQEALALAQARLEYATLTSPLSGVVLSENVEPGEYVAAGMPVVSVADLREVFFRGYVAETDLGKVKVGQLVRVTTDTYPGKVYPGRITFISSEAEFTPKNVQTEKERVKLVYRIKVNLPNPDLELKPGMPAEGEIVLGRFP
jgi:HlyD family secretion protein